MKTCIAIADEDQRVTPPDPLRPQVTNRRNRECIHTSMTMIEH